MAEKQPLSPGSNQSMVAQPAQMVASPQPALVAGPSQPLLMPQQPMIVQIRKSPPKRYDNYEGVRSRALGIIQIVCGVLAVILNAVGIGLNDQAQRKTRDYNRYVSRLYSYYWDDTAAFYVSSGFWATPIMFVCGAFAICAARRPTKCPVVTCLVLGIISSVFAAAMLAIATWAVADDAERLEKGFWYEKQYRYTTDPHYRYSTDPHYRYITVPPPFQMQNVAAESWAKRCVPVSVLFLCVSVVELVACIWLAAIAGKVISADDTQESQSQAQHVQYIAAPTTGTSQPQMMIMDRHGRPIPDAQIVQIPGPSGVQTGAMLAPLSIAQARSVPLTVAPQTQVAAGDQTTTSPAAPAGGPDQSGQIAEATGQLIQFQPPSYTPVGGGQQPSLKSGEDSPPPPYQ